MYKSGLAHMFHEVQSFGSFQVYTYSAYILSWECHTSRALTPMWNLVPGTSSIEKSFHSFYKRMLILSHSTLLGKLLSSSNELEIRLAHFSRSYEKTPVQSQSGVCCGASEITASFFWRCELPAHATHVVSSCVVEGARWTSPHHRCQVILNCRRCLGHKNSFVAIGPCQSVKLSHQQLMT